MKVTILFCLLAVYGAVAQEVETEEAAAAADEATATGATSSFLSKLTPGSIMSGAVNTIKFTSNIRETAVNGSADIGQTFLDMGMNLTGHALDGAKSLIQGGLETAENAKTAATTGAKNITGKVFDLADKMTGSKVKPVLGFINSTALGAISVGDKAASMGISVASNVAGSVIDANKAIVGKVGSGINQAMDKGKNLNKALSDKVIGGMKTGTSFLSKLGQNAGNMISNSFKLSSSS